jgi:cobyrinic acid a,c-diamide synthase
LSAPSASPRVVIAGLSGDAGKTLVSLSLLLALRDRTLRTAAFKKGPDYIDAAWLTWASGSPTRNLDSYLMGFPEAASSFARHALAEGVNIIEGNRGLYDGADTYGTHSTAELAKTLQAPVLLVVNAAKMTRTAAALVLGCQKLDPSLPIGGVILNRLGGSRHESVVRQAVESECGIPVLGALPRAGAEAILPERHLGLVTPAEHPRIAELEADLRKVASGRMDVDRIVDLSRAAPPLTRPPIPAHESPDAGGLNIGVIRDSAFNFYYPENLEALTRAGASLVPISALSAAELPSDLAALYIGGGFPETHGAEISANRSFLESLRDSAAAGLPVYAECGGLMLLSRAILWRGEAYPMAGFFPFSVRMHASPRGHGYSELLVENPNPFYPVGLTIRGHEFHYSAVEPADDLPPTVCRVRRGTGCAQGRDGLSMANTWASYTHIHSLGTPEWAAGFLRAARLRLRSG